MEETDNINKIAYDIIYNRYLSEWNRTYQIENKATNIVGFVGIIFSLLSVTGIYLIERISAGTVYLDSIVYYLLSLVPLMLTILMGIKVLSVKRRSIAPNPQKFWEGLGTAEITASILLQDITEDWVEAIQENCIINQENASDLKKSFVFFTFGIIMTSLFIWSILAHLISI